MAHKNQQNLMRYKPKMEEKIIEEMKSTTMYEKPKIAEGFYPCECINIKRVSDGEHGSRIAIICKIEDVELANVKYLKLTTNSTLTKVLESFGIPFEDKKKFDFSELIGKKAVAVVEDYDYFVDGESKQASTITKFKPLDKTEVEEVK